MSINITALPVASTIDSVNDVLPIVTHSLNTTQQISLNTLLGTSSQTVSINDTQTLTNKTLTSATLATPTINGTVAGTFTLPSTTTFPSAVATLTGTQTLTNKTLTSPTINSPTITNATMSSDTITGYTSSTSGTIYGIGVTSGVITGAGTVGSAALVTNAVQASQIATNAITLGYVQITSNQTTSGTSAAQVSGLSVTVTIPSGSRKIKITAYCAATASSAGSATLSLTIWDGTVGSGTQIAQANSYSTTGNNSENIAIAVVTPSAGSKTYNGGLHASQSGTNTFNASTIYPGFILVEAI